MIYVDGVLFAPDDSSQGMDTLISMLELPALVSASNSFKAITEKKLSVSENLSSESLKNFGTDEATTCVGIVLRNCITGMISVAHMDFPNVVNIGISQMLYSVADQNSDAQLEVHLVGGFNDISAQNPLHATKSCLKSEGYSYALCAKVIETLRTRRERFHIRTLHVLGHNTRWDSEGVAYPIFHGFVVETSSGSILPASFDRTSRCPDEVVRRIRVTASFEDPSWNGRLLETYNTKTGHFVIAPCMWTIQQAHIAMTLRNLSDTEILLACSSSPSAEVPDFVDNEKRKWDYLIQHPYWRETFPSNKPRIFQRNAGGNWEKNDQNVEGSFAIHTQLNVRPT